MHSAVALFADQVSVDPGFRAVKDPICRFAKEIWLRQVWDGRAEGNVESEQWEQIQGFHRSHGDLLSATEIWSLVRETKGMMEEGNIGKGKKHRHGPAAVLAAALEMVGWKIVDTFLWLDRRGEEMDVRAGSPAMLQKYLARDWKTKQWEEAEQFLVGGRGANRAVVEKLFQVWDKGKVLRAGLQWITGVLPTPAWLAAKGWNLEAKCGCCGEMRDLAHEVTGCGEEGRTFGRNGMRASVRKTENMIRGLCREEGFNRKEGIDWEGDIEAWEDGIKVPWESFRFQEKEDIFSDGSSLDTKHGDLSRGAGAAVQRTENGGWRGFMVRVPEGFPKGAAVPEQLAASIALRRCGEKGGACIVTDCEAVVKVARSVLLKIHHKSMFAGMWWDLPWDLACLRKVRSHQPLEKVGMPGEISKEDWEGNNMADEWAGRGVPLITQTKKARRARNLYYKAGEEAREMVQILEKWAGPDWDTISKARQGRQGGRTEVKAVGDSGHRFAWVESMKAWACEECGRPPQNRQGKVQGEVHGRSRGLRGR